MELGSTATFKFAENMVPKLVAALLRRRTIRQQELEAITKVFGDPLKWAEYYIEPHCQQFNPADEHDESRHVVREPLTSRLQHFIGGDDSVSSPHQLILADAGMGKTSCLVMLKLAQLNSFWPKPYEVHLLKLGHDTLEKLSVLTRRKSVVLLDALDEDPLAWGRVTSRLIELLNATKTFTRVIITCRTQFFSGGEDPFNRRGQVEIGGFLCPVVYLSLFDDEQVTQYLKKRFPKDPEIVARAAPIVSKMRALKFRPMLLSRIDDLLDSPSIEWTPYSVYEALVTAWLHRERSKMFEQRKAKNVPSLESLLSACISLAMLMFEQKVVAISLEVIRNAIAFHPDLGEIEEIDIAGRSLLNKNSEGDYRFAHFSVQEYLFTLGILKGKAKLAKQAQFRVTSQILSFLDVPLRKMEVASRRALKLNFLEFSNIEARELDFSNFQLEYVEADSTTFAGTSLDQSNFSDAKFTKCSFLDTTLRKTDFGRCSFGQTRFSKCQFLACQMAHASFRDCEFTGVSFEATSLESVEIQSSAFRECDFSNVRLGLIALRSTTFHSCKLAKDFFANVQTISRSRFELCDLRGVLLPEPALDSKSGNLFVDCKFDPDVGLKIAASGLFPEKEPAEKGMAGKSKRPSSAA